MAILDYVRHARDISGNITSNIITRMVDGNGIDDPTNTDSAEYRALQDSVIDYSLVRPRQGISKFHPTDSSKYDYLIEELIPNYHPDTCSINRIIFPANINYVTNVVGQNHGGDMDPNNWEIIEHPDDERYYLRFLNDIPVSSSTEECWIYWAQHHVVTVSQDTIQKYKPGDIKAISYLMASKLLLMAASYYARTDGGTLQIDAIDYKSKSKEYADLSDKCEKKYQEFIDKRATKTSGRITWYSNTLDGRERFWLRQRFI